MVISKRQRRLLTFLRIHFSLLLHTGIPRGSDGKASAYNAGDPGSIPGSRRSPGERKGNPFQYSRLEKPMDRGAR